MRAMPFLVAIALVLVVSLARADDRHAGYYYPNPVTKEAYRSRTRTMPEASRQARVAFVTNITNGMISKNPYPPEFAMFTKGSRQEKLIIVALRDNVHNTLFRARALLAQLTAVARTTRLIREQMKPSHLTFLDLLHMMGFEQLTISDGKDFSHQIKIN